MRKIILINCVWAAVAAGAFFLAKKITPTIQTKRTPRLQPNPISPTIKALTRIQAIGLAYQAKQAQLKKVQITQ